MATGTRRIVLCADDYGIAPGVGRAIRDLAGAGRISAVSCMTATPYWRQEAELLGDLAARTELGLHLNLTDGAPLAPMPRLAPGGSFPAFGAIARRAVQGALPSDEIAPELERQFDAFVAAVGRPPDFFDGHHHVHQLPQIRDAVLDLYRRRLAGTGAWVRCCWEPPSRVFNRGVAPFRALAIGLFGAPLLKRATRVGVPVNPGFTGIYNFFGDAGLDALMPRFLAFAIDGTVVMCHPGFVDEPLRQADSVTDQREREYRYLMGDSFGELLSRLDISLGPGAPARDA